MQLLQQLARGGCTVLTTIHQPSSEVFFLFDNVTLLLEGGRVIFDGPTKGLVQHMTKHGFECPANYNPADFIMFQMQTKSQELDKLATAWQAEAQALREGDSGASSVESALLLLL